jgi:hypothetical protein
MVQRALVGCVSARKFLFACCIVATVILLGPGISLADPIRIFESGTPGADGQTHGYPIDDGGFTGLRFFVPIAVMTETIGGHFGGLAGTDIFGAIVALSSPGDLPDSQDLSTADLVGGTRIVLSPTGVPVSSRVVSAPLDSALAPGWYALVFGADASDRLQRCSPPPARARLDKPNDDYGPHLDQQPAEPSHPT